jgi:hypothetical protein
MGLSRRGEEFGPVEPLFQCVSCFLGWCECVNLKPRLIRFRIKFPISNAFLGTLWPMATNEEIVELIQLRRQGPRSPTGSAPTCRWTPSPARPWGQTFHGVTWRNSNIVLSRQGN